LELDFEPEQLELGLERPETPDDCAAILTVWEWKPWGRAPAGHFCVFAVEPVEAGPVINVYRFLENAKLYADRWAGVQGGEAQVYDDTGKMVYNVVAPDDAPSYLFDESQDSDYTGDDTDDPIG
jgi:hypothetical protein